MIDFKFEYSSENRKISWGSAYKTVRKKELKFDIFLAVLMTVFAAIDFFDNYELNTASIMDLAIGLYGWLCIFLYIYYKKQDKKIIENGIAYSGEIVAAKFYPGTVRRHIQVYYLIIEINQHGEIRYIRTEGYCYNPNQLLGSNKCKVYEYHNKYAIGDYCYRRDCEHPDCNVSIIREYGIRGLFRKGRTHPVSKF